MVNQGSALLDQNRTNCVDRSLPMLDKAFRRAARSARAGRSRHERCIVHPAVPRPPSFPRLSSLMMRAYSCLSVLAAVALAGCGGTRMDINQMTAAQPADLGQEPVSVAIGSEYRMGVGDKLNVRVFQVSDLSFENLVIDTSGNVQMPLIGSVQAAGRTAGDMASDIATRLAAQYLRDPQVTVTVTEAASQKITVDGAVTKPGVYEMRGSTSLLQAVAMAEGPTRVADLTKVAVFRTIDGRRAVALFDLASIRQGRAADPQVFGDDIIVVDTSRLNSVMREVLAALPGLAVFGYL